MRVVSNLLAGLVLVLGITVSAAAQGQLRPVITVNDRVVTQYELTQRERLLEVFRTPGDLAQQARDGLIDDRLKDQEMARFGVELTDEALTSAMSDFAGRANLDLDQFLTVLRQNGVDEATLRDFVRVGVMWRDFIRGRFGRTVNITDADIERARNNATSGTTDIEVLLNEIIIAAPPPRAAQAQAAAERISRLRSFAAFEAAAREVSALPSRENGGRLGWLPISNYPPQLRSLLLSLRPGEVTDPLNITNGVALFQMRAVREVPRAQPAPASIEYATYFIPGGLSPSGVAAAQQIAARVDTCDDLYGIAKGQPENVLQRDSLPPSDIPSDIALELARLDPGEVSYNLTRADGQTLLFLMLCDRTAVGEPERSDEAIRNQLRSQRLSAQADALLADLRSSAIITQR